MSEGFKVPESAAECADLLYTLRQQRLAKQKEVDAIAEDEGKLKDSLIEALLDQDATGVAGKVGRVTIKYKSEPTADDWFLIHDHIQRTGEFELLQRRLNPVAIRERWEVGQEIPGVSKFPRYELSCVKV